MSTHNTIFKQCSFIQKENWRFIQTPSFFFIPLFNSSYINFSSQKPSQLQMLVVKLLVMLHTHCTTINAKIRRKAKTAAPSFTFKTMDHVNIHSSGYDVLQQLLQLLLLMMMMMERRSKCWCWCCCWFYCIPPFVLNIWIKIKCKQKTFK